MSAPQRSHFICIHVVYPLMHICVSATAEPFYMHSCSIAFNAYMCQRHSGASASTVEQSGAQGTIRLPRAWVKPSRLGRGANNSFCALKPAWRKWWRTLVNSVLVRAKPQCTRRRTRAAPHRSQRQHGGEERSPRHQSLAQGISKAAPPWPGRAILVLCSQTRVAQAVAHSR